MPCRDSLWISITRWTARVIALLLAGIIVLFIVGEGPPPLYVFLPWFVVLAGLAIAWHHELVGGLLILAAFVYFNGVEWHASGRLLRFGAFHVLLIPAALFLICGLCGRRIPPGHCRKCGYDLTGNTSGVCPECGEAWHH